MGPITRAVQTGIDLAAELKAAREVLNTDGEIDEITTKVQEVGIIEKNEEDDKAEDDENFGGATNGLESTTSIDGPSPCPEENLATTNDMKYPLPSAFKERQILNCPVVIPQRRPGNKNRGFLHACAPILGDFDIEEHTFITFLESFHKASQASPVLNVITMGAGAIGHIHEPITIAISATISTLSGTAAEIQSRYRLVEIILHPS
ncbi:hypothetical protein EG329_003933 [Mollisiaceae sp. DMI_Dod_QoI]|nr:hypothetical protein EG329_003933 [Helotiales sp. DMI_Dod_QoI]